MGIENDFLTSANRGYPCDKFSSGRNMADFIIIHYTGSYDGVKGDFNVLQDSQAKVSWHCTIDRNGEVYQHADFRKRCWHAGKSKWFSEETGKTYSGMNKFSIGIELDNVGQLDEDGKSVWGHQVPHERIYQDQNHILWEMYPDEQLDACFDTCMVISEKYNCVDILGHSEISPDRKIDPGSAFPLENLKGTLYYQDFYKWNI